MATKTRLTVVVDVDTHNDPARPNGVAGAMGAINTLVSKQLLGQVGEDYIRAAGTTATRTATRPLVDVTVTFEQDPT